MWLAVVVRSVAGRAVAVVDEVHAAQVGRAVVVPGLVGRELVGLGARRAGLIGRVVVRTDDERRVVLVVETVDRTNA